VLFEGQDAGEVPGCLQFAAMALAVVEGQTDDLKTGLLGQRCRRGRIQPTGEQGNGRGPGAGGGWADGEPDASASSLWCPKGHDQRSNGRLMGRERGCRRGLVVGGWWGMALALTLLSGELSAGGAAAAVSPTSSPASTGSPPSTGSSQPAAAPPSSTGPSPWPAAAAGERRWWIPLPSQPSVSPDGDLSPDPQQWRLELIVGRVVKVDCNRHQFGGRIKPEVLKPQEITIYRADVGPMMSTRMACPDQSLRRRFITLANRPFVVPYDASRPVVVYTPRDVELRWRIWRPERRLQPARPF